MHQAFVKMRGSQSELVFMLQCNGLVIKKQHAIYVVIRHTLL